MVHNAFYLIKPKAEFRSQLAHLIAPDFASLLLEPMLIQDKQPDRSAWNQQDYKLRVKLLFLVSLRQYSPLADDSGAQFILGSAVLDERLFDRWWNIIQIEQVETIETLKTHLATSKVQVDCSKNQLIADWLSEHM